MKPNYISPSVELHFNNVTCDSEAIYLLNEIKYNFDKMRRVVFKNVTLQRDKLIWGNFIYIIHPSFFVM